MLFIHFCLFIFMLCLGLAAPEPGTFAEFLGSDNSGNPQLSSFGSAGGKNHLDL